ncbi:MAG: metallophosphoesterase family protein [Terriglobales bacterium]
MPQAASPTLPQPVFDEPSATQDPSGFKDKHPSDTARYKAIQQLLTKDVVPVPPTRVNPGDVYGLQSALGTPGPNIIKAIVKAGQIVFHATGDSGASNVGKYRNEIRVSDQVTDDCHSTSTANRPAFLYHLGDVVYNFGESKYYYDQFYEPYRNYPAPIFAIPGNHDAFVIPGTHKADTPLAIFQRNFCAPELVITPEAGSLHRTAMTQPGVYFTLDAPFVRIIGLFSNALEDPGVISSENNKWATVSDVQLTYLAAQLQRIKSEQYAGAVLLAVHHPPFSYAPQKAGGGGNHGGSPNMLRQIDNICKQEGVYPHAFISGHAHNYQRYTRTVTFNGSDYEVPFIVCGDGGHNVNALTRAKKGTPSQEPANGTKVNYLEVKPALTVAGLVLKKYDDHNYGYLRITVNKNQLAIGFHQVGASTLAQSRFDMVTIALASHKLIAN